MVYSISATARRFFLTKSRLQGLFLLQVEPEHIFASQRMGAELLLRYLGGMLT